jgi:hypothetical protein
VVEIKFGEAHRDGWGGGTTEAVDLSLISSHWPLAAKSRKIAITDSHRFESTIPCQPLFLVDDRITRAIKLARNERPIGTRRRMQPKAPSRRFQVRWRLGARS